MGHCTTLIRFIDKFRETNDRFDIDKFVQTKINRFPSKSRDDFNDVTSFTGCNIINVSETIYHYHHAMVCTCVGRHSCYSLISPISSLQFFPTVLHRNMLMGLFSFLIHRRFFYLFNYHHRPQILTMCINVYTMESTRVYIIIILQLSILYTSLIKTTFLSIPVSNVSIIK